MKILVLSTWFPFPTIQGSKLRAYHLIKGLSRAHDVALLSMQDTPVQADWMAEMRRYCRQVTVVPVHPFDALNWKRRLSLLSLKPSAAAAAYSPLMAQAVRQAVTEFKPDALFALTFVTAQYALQTSVPVRIVDMDNLLALMLYEEFQHTSGMARRARAYLAYWKFERYERDLYRQFDRALVCSAADVARARQYIPLTSERIGVTPNGVEVEAHLPPENTRPGSLIFNGAVTYAPNLDAVQFFHSEILPLVLQRVPQAQLTVTGRRDGVDPTQLPPESTALQYSGFLPDIRAAVAASQVCVVPLRKGAGTRLKILEAMAVGTPVVTTPKGAEGLEVIPGMHILIGATPQEFAAQTIRLLTDSAARQAQRQAAYELVKEKYAWEGIQQQLNTLFLHAAAEKGL